VKRITVLSGIVALIIFLVLSSWYFDLKLEHFNETSKDNMEVVFFSFEAEGESILISQGNDDILIDTGTKDQSRKILDYLKLKEINEIDYLILTHPLEGNIGGALDVLEQVKVKTVIQPYCGTESESLLLINKYITDKKINCIIPTKNRKFILGNLNLVVYPPLKKSYTDVRNYSLATLVSYKKINMLFSANANKKRNQELLSVHWPKIDLYKIPNYGKENKLSRELIYELKPNIAVSTSDSVDNGIKEALFKSKSKVNFINGEYLIFSSDGENIQCTNRNGEFNGK